MRWGSVERGRGAAALVVGEAGIGKSRLIQEFLAHRIPPTTPILSAFASPFDADSPLRPVVDLLQKAAGIDARDDRQAVVTKLMNVLTGDHQQKRLAADILVGLFGFAAGESGVRKPTPEELRERTMSTLADQLLLMSAEVPMCVVVEDVHWLDPTTTELLEMIIPRLPKRRVFLLLTGREEQAATWSTRVQTVVHLGPLSVEQVRGMVGALVGRGLNESLADKIADRTDGVPLFVEEVTRFLLSAGDGIQDVVGTFAERIPASLDELLMARLDRSGTAKGVAQAAAVVGRSPRRDVLKALCEMNDEEFEPAIESLLRSGIFEPTGSSGPESSRFHHALLRDAAYASLLRDQRKDLHIRAAQAIQLLEPERVALFPETLAEHLTEGGLAEAAAPHWMEAARQSLARSGSIEATRLLRRGLASLEALPQTENTTRLRVRLSALLGPALIGVKGPNSPETLDLYSSAYELCQALPEDPAHFPIYWGWWRLSPANLSRASKLLDRAIERNDPELLMQAHHCSWATHFQVASLAQSRHHIEAGLSIYGKGDFKHHVRLYGNHDAKVCAHGCLSQIYWMEGKLKSALREEAESLSWANEMDHVGSHLHAKGLTLLHRVYRRDYAEVFRRSEELIAFAAEHGFADHGSAGLVFQGWVTAARSGEPAAGLKVFEEGLARQREVATNEDFPVFLTFVGDFDPTRAPRRGNRADKSRAAGVPRSVARSLDPRAIAFPWRSYSCG